MVCQTAIYRTDGLSADVHFQSLSTNLTVNILESILSIMIVVLRMEYNTHHTAAYE